MIVFKHSDLPAPDVDALVNAVNRADVMGKGLALQCNTRSVQEKEETMPLTCIR